MRKGTWIPVSIEALPINSSAKIVLAEIDNLHRARICNAGNNHFAKILGVSPETVSRIISKLKKMGFVNQISFDGRVRVLEPCILNNSALTEEAKQDLAKDQGRIDEQFKAAFANNPNPLYSKKQYKEKIKNNRRELETFPHSKNSESKSLSKFLEWGRTQFSGSTRELLMQLNSLESLLKCENRTVQIAWERWL